ncbi:hypothetical protein HYS49_00250, partial [Candidatus Woesearchaeota archaeon]|nr:hypothetical protein [Candidatus Woesearchaeota archaeon]
ANYGKLAGIPYGKGYKNPNDMTPSSNAKYFKKHKMLFEYYVKPETYKASFSFCLWPSKMLEEGMIDEEQAGRLTSILTSLYDVPEENNQKMAFVTVTIPLSRGWTKNVTIDDVISDALETNREIYFGDSIGPIGYLYKQASLASEKGEDLLNAKTEPPGIEKGWVNVWPWITNTDNHKTAISWGLRLIADPTPFLYAQQVGTRDVALSSLYYLRKDHGLWAHSVAFCKLYDQLSPKEKLEPYTDEAARWIGRQSIFATIGQSLVSNERKASDQRYKTIFASLSDIADRITKNSYTSQKDRQWDYSAFSLLVHGLIVGVGSAFDSFERHTMGNLLHQKNMQAALEVVPEKESYKEMISFWF